MKSGKEQSHWTLLEILLVVIAWVAAIILLGSVIIKIRVLFKN